MRWLTAFAWIGVAAATACGAAELPEASWQKLPRWRGFNLLEKFNVGKNEPFREDDFRMISELGFNFVRLPMDYRCWIVGGDWRRFNETTLKEIDQAVEYGRKHGVHVLLNFHRAPGYTVASPKEAKSLWTDPEAQEVCALHWGTFARRYKGIPNRNLSFNLLNEPSGVEAEAHAAAIGKLVAAIRAEDPERLVICDSRQWGNAPSDELIPLKVAQATRGYQPMEVTHYKASWVGIKEWTKPSWPMLDASGWLAGPGKKKEGAPLRIEGPFEGVTTMRVRVHEVSAHSKLVVQADGRPVFEHVFRCGPGTGEWTRAVYRPQWKDYQNVYDRDYEVPVPAGTRVLVLDNVEGDWMTVSEVALRGAGGDGAAAVLRPAYGQKPAVLTYRPGASPALQAPGPSGRAWLEERCIAPFRELQGKGVGVMVGEFGAFNHTPHPVVMRWMADCLANWKDAGWGWAMWNFRGPFGVLDSGRGDVVYEDFQGHKLDRAMLDLLRAN